MSKVLLPVPHRQQNDEGECVAICAVMALEYIGVEIPYETILRILRTEWFGTVSSKLLALKQ